MNTPRWTHCPWVWTCHSLRATAPGAHRHQQLTPGHGRGPEAPRSVEPRASAAATRGEVAKGFLFLFPPFFEGFCFDTSADDWFFFGGGPCELGAPFDEQRNPN